VVAENSRWLVLDDLVAPMRDAGGASVGRAAAQAVLFIVVFVLTACSESGSSASPTSEAIETPTSTADVSPTPTDSTPEPTPAPEPTAVDPAGGSHPNAIADYPTELR